MEAHETNRTFETGSVRDGGKKPALQLISPHAMFRLGEWLRFACEDREPKPYPMRNWEKGQPYSQILASVIRHAYKLLLGDETEDHASALMFGGMALAHYQEEVKAGRLPASLDDLPHYLGQQSAREQVTARLDALDGTAGIKEETRAAVSAQARPFTVYLCGPITGQQIDFDWRISATELLVHHGIATLNPLRGKDPSKIHNNGLGYAGSPASTEMADRDHADVEESDLIFAHFPYAPSRQSIGSLMEMGGAAIGLKKPIVLCTDIPEFNEHLFCRRFCHLEPNYRRAVEYIIRRASNRV